jgi:hypothetical protein
METRDALEYTGNHVAFILHSIHCGLDVPFPLKPKIYQASPYENVSRAISAGKILNTGSTTLVKYSLAQGWNIIIIRVLVISSQIKPLQIEVSTSGLRRTTYALEGSIRH